MQFDISKMFLFNLLYLCTAFWPFWQSKVSLEPVIFSFVFSNFLANGAQQNTQLLIRKVCMGLGYNFTTCQDQQSRDPLVHLEVLRETNM